MRTSLGLAKGLLKGLDDAIDACHSCDFKEIIDRVLHEEGNWGNWEQIYKEPSLHVVVGYFPLIINKILFIVEVGSDKVKDKID